ncbi:hypothetical protein VNI00_016978 [Paramarasmius palmivorus]|uniref:SAP domain-containing protein n=1 Tax=Paramarasmius palmivorus TaxID=297713 RepID=A0AAW0BAW3_9AGAR
MTIRDVPRVYMVTRNQAFKTETIQKAFHRSGIDVSSGSPQVDRKAFTDKDFAPSVASSTLLDLPSSTLSLINGTPVSEHDTDMDSEDEDHRLPGPLAPSDTEDEDYVPDTSDSDQSDDETTDITTLFSSPTFHHDIKSMDANKLCDMISDAKDIVDNLQSFTDNTRSHIVVLGNYAKKLKGQLNAKKRRKGGKDRTVNVYASITTSAEGRAAAEEQAKERAERKEKTQQKQHQREAHAVSVCKLREEIGRGNMVFKQPMSKLNSQDLRNVCWNLDILETGTRSIMVGRINDHFDLHPLLRNDSHYVALFSARNAPDAPARMERGTRTFTEPFAKLKVPDLQDLCYHLSLDESGLKPALLKRIRSHFDGNNTLVLDPRYAVLFPRKRKQGPDVDEVSPPSQRPRLSAQSQQAFPSPSPTRNALGDITPARVNNA